MQLQLQHSRKQYEQLFENAPIGYFVLDDQGSIVDVNQNGAELLQTDRSMLYDRPFVVFVRNESHEAFFLHLQKVFQDHRIHSVGLPMVDRHGRRIWGQLKSRLQEDTDGVARCFTAIIDDSQRKRIEDDLILAREDALQASQAKSLFLANMSHEIRTPMNGILAMSELALHSEITAEQRQTMEVIYHSARALTSIIDDVLDFSRIEANAVKLENAAFDLGALVTTVAALFKPQAQEKHLEFRVEIDSKADRWFRGDQYRIRQVLSNLLSNAVKFTEQGEVVLTASAQPISEYIAEVAFSVRDTGIGIPGELEEHVFDSFTQADIGYAKHYQGTGLGLAISRRLARLMSGQLYFQSVEGAGTTFYFTCPLHVEEPTPVSASLAGNRFTTPASVLVAEDDSINTLVIKTILEQAGYIVGTAGTGSQALDLLQKQRWDLVLMDISMPDMNGLEATRRIRSCTRSGSKSLPIVAITAHSMKGDREDFLDAGMDAYLAKPFTRQQVLDTVERLLGSRDE